MNFLELCQRLRQECGIPGTGPTSVLSQTGEMKRLVDWVAQSWVEIQEERPDWQFLRKDFTFSTVANQQSYDITTEIGLTDFASWKNHSFRIYSVIADENFLAQYPYDQFRDIYLRSSLLSSYARPNTISIAPDEDLVLALPPDAVYTVKGEYYTAPVEITADASVPGMPPRFHMAIVYLAMKKYGISEVASEIYSGGKELYDKLYSKLSASQAPKISGTGGYS